MTEVGRPAALYDGPDANSTLIGNVLLRTSRRAAYAAVPHKLDDGWVERAHGERAVEMRVTAEGITAPSWMAGLIERQDGGLGATYHLAFIQGDSYTGTFVVEQLDEIGNEQDRRRFVLILLSSGKIVYTSS